MAAVTDLSDLINLSTGGGAGAPETAFWFKSARIAGVAPTAPVVGRPASLWRYDGNPAGGAIPGAAAVPTRATQGALPFTNPGGGRQKWMMQAWCSGLVAGTLVLYDRLLHNGGLVGNVATAQTVGGTLTRNTGGVGNRAWVEIYTAIGGTATTVTMSYTNQAGTSGRTSTAVAIGGTGFNEATRMILMPLQGTDTGIQAIASITLAATTGTAGSIGATIGRPLAYMPMTPAGGFGWRDFTTGLPGVPEVPTDACLALYWIPQTTTVPEFDGGYGMVEK
jgi:hypothetical protein